MSETPKRLALVTCSMARDRDFFSLLARSIDTHIPSDILHRVVVPASDMAAFRDFRTPSREIIAQEDVAFLDGQDPEPAPYLETRMKAKRLGPARLPGMGRLGAGHWTIFSQHRQDFFSRATSITFISAVIMSRIWLRSSPTRLNAPPQSVHVSPGSISRRSCSVSGATRGGGGEL